MRWSSIVDKRPNLSDCRQGPYLKRVSIVGTVLMTKLTSLRSIQRIFQLFAKFCWNVGIVKRCFLFDRSSHDYRATVGRLLHVPTRFLCKTEVNICSKVWGNGPFSGHSQWHEFYSWKQNYATYHETTRKKQCPRRTRGQPSLATVA